MRGWLQGRRMLHGQVTTFTKGRRAMCFVLCGNGGSDIKQISHRHHTGIMNIFE